MPELPEVETVRRGLNKFIIHQKLTDVTILSTKSFQGHPVFGTVKNIRRFGKALVLDLDNGFSLMIHLRMTGQLIFDPLVGDRYAAGHPSNNFVASLPNQQTRVILVFTNGTLYFNDQRKFGFIKSLATDSIEQEPFIQKLASEPWDMSEQTFYSKLQKHRTASIKSVILDQSIICGLGNIYADESLFASKIHPATKAGALSQLEASALLKNACAVMEKSIASGGSTMATYIKPDGTRGDYLEKFAQVFRKEGTACPRCGTKIIKLKVAGRGTHVCPHCQQFKALEGQEHD